MIQTYVFWNIHEPVKGQVHFLLHLVPLFGSGFGVCDGDCLVWLCSLILKVGMIWWHSSKRYSRRDCMLVSGLDPSLNPNGNMGMIRLIMDVLVGCSLVLGKTQLELGVFDLI